LLFFQMWTNCEHRQTRPTPNLIMNKLWTNFR
jgi:hypothetical protein